MHYLTLLDETFRDFTGTRFAVEFWNKETRYYGNGTEIAFTLHITNPKVVTRLLSDGALGFGESYMDGSLDITGDIDAYFRIRHQFKRLKPSLRLAFLRTAAKLSSPFSRRKQIAYHYDLGTEFFSLFLDKETMSYSAGHFLSPADSLAEAQLQKLHLICDWLDLPPHASILDFGSGWGGFAEYAAQMHNWDTTGYTLSEKQIAYAKHKRALLALDKHITYEHTDFTTLTNRPTKQFKGGVMIESIEHIGQKQLKSFMKQLNHQLEDGAPLYMQFTGRYAPKTVDAWTLKYVFPGGHLPDKPAFLKAAYDAGFTVEQFEDATADYIQTLTLWIEALEASEDIIIQMFDKRFYRLWKLWMHGARVSFELSAMNLFRVLLRKP